MISVLPRRGIRGSRRKFHRRSACAAAVAALRNSRESFPGDAAGRRCRPAMHPASRRASARRPASCLP
ncbi:twin-arginine translocation signal domain-containing protein [Oxalobacteraceae bacterium CAVE-383]|nr:twin-arginine translocation signal domain-containing protein [Oxalobacteraceae bacterium CAVE-383]